MQGLRKPLFSKKAREAINKLLDTLPHEGQEALKTIIKRDAELRHEIEAFRQSQSKTRKERC